MTTPRVSVFTPSHDTTYLDDCYQSLLAQTFTDWQWVVLLNGGARWEMSEGALDDDRITLVVVEEISGVGAAKSYACRQCTGEILVELDHDDVLLPEALAAVVAAFDLNPEVGFVYSQFAQVDAGLNDPTGGSASPFDPAYGWTYRPVAVEGRLVTQPNAMEPLPHNVAYIWYAPNHLRAFRRSLYEAVGGYDASRTVLDDQDLMCRMYQRTDFLLIDECLYLQRAHHANTQARQDTNAFIQTETVELYDKYVQPMALAWAARRRLLALDLGAAHGKPEGYVGVDLHKADGVDYVGDVFDVLSQFEDNSVGVIRAVDFLEHIADKVRLLNECHRVLAHGGMFLTLTPSTDGRGAFQDPTHVSYWNENAFWYFTNQEFAQFVPEITARFQVGHMRSGHPTQWHVDNDIAYVNANLLALKPGGPRLGGLKFWPEHE